jgi:hypothetical protein
MGNDWGKIIPNVAHLFIVGKLYEKNSIMSPYGYSQKDKCTPEFSVGYSYCTVYSAKSVLFPRILKSDWLSELISNFSR